MSLLAAIATGLLLALCYPPAAIGWLVWWALIPLVAVLWARPTTAPAAPPAWWRPARPPGAFLHGFLAGATFFVINLSWLRHVTPPGMVMLALYLALYPALWALFAATVGRPRRWHSNWEITRAIFLTAAAWTGLEWLRGIVFTGFGWNGLGVALHNTRGLPMISQWAEWIGVTGLSFFVAAHAAAIAFIWVREIHPRDTGRPRPIHHRPTSLALAALTAQFVAFGLGRIGTWRGLTVMPPHDQDRFTVALVQPNVPQESKNLPESFDSMALALDRLTREAFSASPKPDIVVWPESSLPAPLTDSSVQSVLGLVSELGDFDHILGIDDQEIDAYFNSIAHFRGNPADATVHHKVHLVPFGEYLPARGLFGRFDFIREQLPGDFFPGTSTEPIPLKFGASGLSAIPLVCFEDTIGRVARRFARSEPQLIVNVTNDAWFRDSAGADQHLANAVFRTIELRRPMVRAANTGVTAGINSLGRVTESMPRLIEGHVKASVQRPSYTGLTFYARFGDAFSITLLATALLATAQHVALSRSRSNEAAKN